jgi:hypothetical protein
MRSLSKTSIASLALVLGGRIVARGQRPPQQPPAPTPQRGRPMRYHLCTLLLSAVFFTTVTAYAQTTQRQPAARPIPAKQVYGHLFYMVDTVEHDADGADGHPLI